MTELREEGGNKLLLGIPGAMQEEEGLSWWPVAVMRLVLQALCLN